MNMAVKKMFSCSEVQPHISKKTWLASQVCFLLTGQLVFALILFLFVQSPIVTITVTAE